MAEARRNPSAEWQRLRRRRSKPSPWSGLLIGVLLTVFLVILSYTGYLLYVWARSALNLPAPGGVGAVTGDGTQPGVQDGADGQLTDYNNPQGSGTSDRINVLILGVDQRPGEGEATRADTIIVVTIDPQTGKAGMISIPRDLYVEIPGGRGQRKINTAYFLGGPQLSKETVQQVLGHEIDYYVKINFDGFEYLIDLIGGIWVNVPFTIYDPEFPDEGIGYDPFYLEAGRQHLDGETALKYARVRNIDSDFGRARRQQQVLLAIKDQLFQQQMISFIARNAFNLTTTLVGSVSSDISVSQIPTLLDLANKVNMDSISQLVIDESLGTPYSSDETGWILIPDMPAIHEAVENIFAPPATPIPAASPVNTIAQQLAAEGARIQVLNGAGVENLATDTSAWLRAQGFNVVDIGNADQDNYEHSIVTDFSGKQFTLDQLARLFNVSASNIRAGAALGNNVDIRLVIGQDFEIPTP